jgi:hypothetical protein
MELKLKEFVRKYGQPYSSMLGINVKSDKRGEILKWFLASILYGKPIRESTATQTYKLFEEEGILTPQKIEQTGWEGIVSILDEGGYTRYDFSTATKLLEVLANLKENYAGDLNSLHSSATDSLDLEKRLMSLGKGIGETTVSIFLRDMRPVWPKANPSPSPLVKLAMKRLGIKDLKYFAKKNHFNVVQLETAFLRLGKDFIKKGKEIDIEIN